MTELNTADDVGDIPPQKERGSRAFRSTTSKLLSLRSGSYHYSGGDIKLPWTHRRNITNDPITVIETAEQYKDLVSSESLSRHINLYLSRSYPQSRTDDSPIIDFWANWCVPCKAVAPRFEKLAQSHSHWNIRS